MAVPAVLRGASRRDIQVRPFLWVKFWRTLLGEN
jgi:hypothetical protein